MLNTRHVLNTSQKLFIAHILCSFVMAIRRLFFLSEKVVKSRGGVKWALDLKEGIDLAIYALGGFELRSLRLYKKLVHANDVVLDIGANIGSHTLPLAQIVGDGGQVIAFEPTKYAVDKLAKNIELNTYLAPRIKVQQTMLMHSNFDQLPASLYSSWPLDNSLDLHKDHRGRLMSTEGAKLSTLDQYIEDSGIERVNFIKLDVDGNEYDVLMGGQETLKRFRPTLMMELAPCVYETCPNKFDDMLKMLWGLGYELSDVSNRKKLPQDLAKVRHLIPSRGGINALATRVS